MYGIPKNVTSKCSFHRFCISFLYVGSYPLIKYYLGDFAYYVVWLESAVAMQLSLFYVVLVCHQYDVCEIMLAVCMLLGMVVRAKADFFRELCPVSFLVVGESPSVLL